MKRLVASLVFLHMACVQPLAMTPRPEPVQHTRQQQPKRKPSEPDPVLTGVIAGVVAVVLVYVTIESQ